MEKAVVKTEAQLPTDPSQMGALGAENLSSSDMLIPKILICQGTSELVQKEKALPGDIARSTDGEILATRKDKKPLNFVVVSSNTTSILEQMPDGKKQFEFVKVEQYRPEAALEFVENGVKYRRKKSMNFFVLLEKDLKEGIALPHVLSFQMTAMRFGQALATNLQMSAMAKKPVWEKMYSLSVDMKSNDDNSWYVPVTAKAGFATPLEMQKTAYEWYTTLKDKINSQMVIHDEEEKVTFKETGKF